MMRFVAKGLLPALALGGCGTPALEASANDASAAKRPVASGPAPSPSQQVPSLDSSYRAGAGIIREILVADGTLDGAAITDFRLDDPCTTTIVTARGMTTVQWAGVTNIVSATKGGRRDIRIERDAGPVGVSVTERGDTPTGNPALQLESGFGHLVNECQS